VGVAPPQAPVGVEFTKLNNDVVLVVHVVDGAVNVPASKQVDWEYIFPVSSRKIITLPNIFHTNVRMGRGIFIILDSFRVLRIFGY